MEIGYSRRGPSVNHGEREFERKKVPPAGLLGVRGSSGKFKGASRGRVVVSLDDAKSGTRLFHSTGSFFLKKVCGSFTSASCRALFIEEIMGFLPVWCPLRKVLSPEYALKEGLFYYNSLFPPRARPRDTFLFLTS